jgi:hypothetical protein
MINRIVLELETPGDSRTLFRLSVGDNVVGESLTAVQAHILIGEVLDRIALPRQANQRTVSAEVMRQAPRQEPQSQQTEPSLVDKGVAFVQALRARSQRPVARADQERLVDSLHDKN